MVSVVGVRKPVLVALLVLGGTVVEAAEAGHSIPTTPEFALGTERVQVDVVVRDKKGAVLRGLRASDFEVTEDGVRQDVESLDLQERAAPALWSPADPTKAPALAPPTFLAVAFDRLSPGARVFAQQAMARYIDAAPEANAWFGAFAIDRGLSTVQFFTPDRDTLKKALGAAASQAPTQYTGLRERDEVRNAYAGLAQGIGQSHVAAAELSGVPECRGAEDDVHRRLELLDAQLVETYDGFERDEQGFATAHALLALVDGLSRLPGRKAIVLFSEGLVIPARAEAAFRSVVSAAQRGHVAIYSVDAGGLHAASSTDEARRTIDVLQARLQADTNSSPVVKGPSASDQGASRLTLLEKNEDALRFAAEGGLGRLAEQTGGFLIRDTNDLSPGLTQIDEDLGTYYLLSYSPRNQTYDGSFRTISIKLKAPHGRLQARQGYLALKSAVAVPALDFEAPALARLGAGGPLPTQVPVRLGGLQFPVEPGRSVVPVVIEIPAGSLSFQADKKAGTFRQDFTIVALIRDAAGEVVAKMSQHYPVSGPLGRLDEARGAEVRFYRETHLPPGTYRLEAVAYDALANTAGGVRASLEVPGAASGHLRASSVIVVRTAEKLPASADAAPRPLQYHDVLLYPNLDRPMRRTAGQELTFFVTAWPAIERPGVSAQVEVSRDGQKVAATSPARLLPDADGRILLASSVPLTSFKPGAYELRVTLSDGRDAETRTTAFPIAP
jgi:VWFA-related protein